MGRSSPDGGVRPGVTADERNLLTKIAALLVVVTSGRDVRVYRCREVLVPIRVRV